MPIKSLTCRTAGKLKNPKPGGRKCRKSPGRKPRKSRKSPRRSMRKSPRRSMRKSPRRSMRKSPRRSMRKSPRRSKKTKMSSPLGKNISFYCVKSRKKIMVPANKTKCVKAKNGRYMLKAVNPANGVKCTRFVSDADAKKLSCK